MERVRYERVNGAAALYIDDGKVNTFHADSIAEIDAALTRAENDADAQAGRLQVDEHERLLQHKVLEHRKCLRKRKRPTRRDPCRPRGRGRSRPLGGGMGKATPHIL